MSDDKPDDTETDEAAEDETAEESAGEEEAPTEEVTGDQERSSGTPFNGAEGLAVAVLIIGIGIGFGAASFIGAPGGGQDTAGSADTVRQSVQPLVDSQLQQQRASLQQAANRSENLTMDDLSIDAEVTAVTGSQFPSLFAVNVTYTGTVPRRLGAGTRTLDQTQTFYVSGDGRYLFQQPTDLEASQQQ
jgi:hypothetical protein